MKKAFSLVELVITMAIALIILVIVIPSYTSKIADSKNAKAIAILATLNTNLQSAEIELGGYSPTPATVFNIINGGLVKAWYVSSNNTSEDASTEVINPGDADEYTRTVYENIETKVEGVSAKTLLLITTTTAFTNSSAIKANNNSTQALTSYNNGEIYMVPGSAPGNTSNSGNVIEGMAFCWNSDNNLLSTTDTNVNNGLSPSTAFSITTGKYGNSMKKAPIYYLTGIKAGGGSFHIGSVKVANPADVSTIISLASYPAKFNTSNLIQATMKGL